MNWQLEALLAFLAFTVAVSALSLSFHNSLPLALHRLDELHALSQAHECSSTANFAFAYSAGFVSFPSYCISEGNAVSSQFNGVKRKTLLLNAFFPKFQDNEWVLVLDANAHYR